MIKTAPLWSWGGLEVDSEGFCKGKMRRFSEERAGAPF
jgi:hypothetical protein